ncbi:MAG TPA: FAD-dependent oxidoreductase [Pyrinomonadaceae bacterium]|jgi:prolycopene isomerase|nr:FAD-dependent oxidoreductase [Pyrinomonadaceae bacterium]
MSYDVLVVGGGIGGLTCAALLAARGVSVCLVEREAEAGGCAMTREISGHRFEPGAGLYASWRQGGIHERVFAELPVEAPEVREAVPPYVLRLPGGEDVRVGGPAEEFYESLRAAFPECAGAAVAFYEEILAVAGALERAALRAPDLLEVSGLRRLKLVAGEPRLAPLVLKRAAHRAGEHLSKTSARFRRFLDAQLQIYAQADADACAYPYAAVALAQPVRGMHLMRGGGGALASALVESIRRSGGTVRLNTTAIRLALDSRGRAAGVVLLTGETVEARRAVASNLTVWDTYGKLLGTGATPSGVRARLKSLRGWGAYQIFVSGDESALARLPSERVLALTDWGEGREFTPEGDLFMLGAAPAWDPRAPAGLRAVTVSAFTDAEQWFTFHTDEAEHETADQRALEELWGRMHAALPELGDGVEVIETATPRTFYERTRRRLGLVGGTPRTPDALGPQGFTHRTPIPNLYMTGDTVFPGNGLAAVTHSALVVADEIAPRR